jgi:hypothetical protein
MTTTLDTMELRRILEVAANAGLKSGEWRADTYGLQIWADGLRDGDTHILDIRGWGYLTGRGHGALALAEDEAIAIQRAWQAHVVAFDPATCRALLDRLDALEGLLRESVDLTGLCTTPERFSESGTGEVFLRMTAHNAKARAFLSRGKDEG